MSLSVSYNQNIKSGIDSAALREVTQQIFQRATGKTAELTSLDLSKFDRPTIGTDLYSSKVDVDTARQIAVANSGMNVKLSEKALESLKYLNSQASKNTLSAVDGKITLPEVKEANKNKNVFSLPTFGQLVETADLGADKRGSNPFYRGELLATENKKEEKSEEKTFSIFA